MLNLKLVRFLSIFCMLYGGSISAQKFKYSIPGLDTLERSFIVGGGASTVLRSGEGELILNNSLVSYQIAFHSNGDDSPVLDRLRNTQFSTEATGFYGLSQTGRWDLGLQVRYTRSRLDNAASNSPLKVFDGANKSTSNTADPFNGSIKLDESFGGFAHLGFRVRFKPILRRPELVVNGGYSIGIVKDRAEQIQLNADRDVLDLGLTYYQGISNNVYYHFGASIRAFLPSIITDESLYNSNFSFFLIQRSKNKKLTLYPGLSYSLNFKPSKFDSHPLIKTADFLFALGGIQYAFNTNFNLFATLGFPLIVNVTHPQQEIVRQSYSLFSIGARAGF